MTRVEDFAAYINYDACDTSGSGIKGRSTEECPEPSLLAPLKFHFLAPWRDTIVPLLVSDQGTCKAIFRESSPLLNSSASISNSASSQSMLFSINPSAVFWTAEPSKASDDMDSDVSDPSRSPSPLMHPPSISNFDSIESGLFRFSSPFSDPSSFSATDSDDCSLFSQKTSAVSSPASSVSSLNDHRRSPSPETFLPPPALHSPITKWSYRGKCGDCTRPNTRNIGQKIRSGRNQDQARPLRTRRRCVLPNEDQPHQKFPSVDLSSSLVALDKNGKRRWLCLCGKSFTRGSDRKRHSEDSTSCPIAKGRQEEQNQAGDPRFVCEHCEKAFSRYDSLDRHQRNRNACPGILKPSSSQ